MSIKSTEFSLLKPFTIEEAPLIKPFSIEKAPLIRPLISACLEKETVERVNELKVPQIKVRETLPPVIAQTTKPQLLDFPADDIGNVKRFLSIHGDILRFNVNTGKFLIWNGRSWEQDDVRGTKKMAEKVMEKYRKAAEPFRMSQRDDLREMYQHSRQSCNNGRLNALVDMLKHEKAVLDSVFDAYPHLLNVQNGVIDLRNGHLQNNQKDLLLTQTVDVDYIPGAYRGSRFEDFVTSVCGEDECLAQYLQKVFGYAVTGETKEQSLFLFYGQGSNGKTTLLEAIDEVLHDFVHHIPIAVLMDSSSGNSAGKASPELAQSSHARILFTSESNEGDYLNEGKLKMLTGETTISVRQLYCEPFEFRPAFKIIFDTNHLPRVRGKDFAIWRRLKVIPFTQTFSGASVDKYLPQKLKSRREQEAILAWLVEGAVKYYQEGLHDIPSVVSALQGYREEVDTIAPFLQECVSAGADYVCKAAELYAAYQQYCEENQQKTETLTAFGNALKANGYSKRRTANGIVYAGIKVRE